MKPEKETPCISREGKTDSQYISALEASNKSLRSENRRLVNLVLDGKRKQRKEK